MIVPALAWRIAGRSILLLSQAMTAMYVIGRYNGVVGSYATFIGQFSDSESE